jgi:MFS family permease
VGGSFIDAHDRRRTLMWAQVAHTVSSAILLAGAIQGHPPVWLIYFANALHAFVSSVDGPTRSAMTPRLVGKALMPSAVALNQVLWQTVGIVGSAVGGLLIAQVGFGAAYAIDLATYGALFFAAYLMHPMPPGSRAGQCHGMGGGEGGVRVRATEPLDPVDVRDRPDRDDLRHAAGAVHVPRHLAVPPRS